MLEVSVLETWFESFEFIGINGNEVALFVIEQGFKGICILQADRLAICVEFNGEILFAEVVERC